MRARYSAYTVATGRYFFFCDSDDFLPDDALETLYTAAEASGADITVGNMLMVNPSGKQILRTRAQRCGTTSESYLRSILHWNSPTVWGSLFRRELFAEPYTALHKQGFSEDRILMTELLLRHNAKVCPVTKPTYYYWLNNTSITRSKLTEKDVRSQFAALFRCYDLVDSIAPGLRADNNNYMARYLSLYIEKGVSASLLRSIDERVPPMLRFAEMKQWTGARLAAHTALCIHLPGYRATMHGIRSIIRKLQGKD